jgi:hypothetical protein
MTTLMRDLLIYSIISADSGSKVAFLMCLIDMRAPPGAGAAQILPVHQFYSYASLNEVNKPSGGKESGSISVATPMSIWAPQ